MILKNEKGCYYQCVAFQLLHFSRCNSFSNTSMTFKYIVGTRDSLFIYQDAHLFFQPSLSLLFIDLYFWFAFFLFHQLIEQQLSFSILIMSILIGPALCFPISLASSQLMLFDVHYFIFHFPSMCNNIVRTLLLEALMGPFLFPGLYTHSLPLKHTNKHWKPGNYIWDSGICLCQHGLLT